MSLDDPYAGMTAREKELAMSADRTGRRFWSMRPQNFKAFEANLRVAFGIPKGEGTRAVTLRAMNAAEDMPVANDGSGKILVNLDRYWIAGNVPVENSPHVTELTDADYEALKPNPTTTP